MRSFVFLLAPALLAVSGSAFAQTVPPPADTSGAPFPAAGACLKDTDCKGDRICFQAQCVEPQKTPPPATTTSPLPPADTTAPPPPAATTASPTPPTPSPPPGHSEPEWNSRGYSTPRAAQPAASAWDRLGLHGIEVEVRLGFMLPDGSSPVRAPNLYRSPISVGDILSGTEHPYGMDPLGIMVAAGYRFFPWLSVGAFFSYASFNSLDGTDTGDYLDATGGNTSQLERQMWTLGLYGRYYFTQFHHKLHPWLELGLGYSDDNANYIHLGPQAPSGPEQENMLLEEKGLVARLTAGLDWRLAPVFAVGPWVAYERVVPITGCVEVDIAVDPNAAGPNPDASTPNTCGGNTIQANGYGVVSGGIFLKLTVDPLPR
jgi:hypothetical protein